MFTRNPLASGLATMVLLVCPSAAISQTQWVKSDANPVISPGEVGAWDEASAAATTVLFHADLYKMWYGANDSIGHATSTDGMTWLKNDANPVLEPGPPRSWDEAAVDYASVLVINDIYRMWYSGSDGSGTERIGHAWSLDGIDWTKDPNNPILDLGNPGEWDDEAVIHPYVVFEDPLYRMWYNGHDGTTQRILYAYSLDGVQWTRFTDHSMLEPGDPGSWDDLALGPVSVLHAINRYHMWYTGWNQSHEFRIGYATSPDGLEWTKDLEDNPVLTPGNPGTWDDVMVGLPNVMLEDWVYVMWYAGGGTKLHTGYATSHSCILRVEGVEPTTIQYVSSFDLVGGLLSDPPDFWGATCIGTFSGIPGTDSLPALLPGEGRYYLGRGLTDCIAQGYGDSSLDPDPRDDLDLSDPCPPLNLVANGDMENWISPTNLLVWQEIRTAGTIDEETSPGYVYEGDSAARLTRTSSGVFNIAQTSIPLEPGEDYRLELAAMFSEARAGALQVRIQNFTRGEDLRTDGSWSTGWHYFDFDLAPSYQRHQIDFTVDAGYEATDDFRLIIRHNNVTPTPIGSEMWIDDVAIRVQ